MATETYDNLITPQHRTKPKYMAWLNAALNVINDGLAVPESFTETFDLDKAVGSQLDVIGDIVGRSRILPFNPSNGSSPILRDDVYRLLLKAKIAQNQWDGTADSIRDLWDTLFSDIQITSTAVFGVTTKRVKGRSLVIRDNQDMTMTVTVYGPVTVLEEDLIAHGLIVPKPEGVRLNYQVSDIPIFGYDLDNGAVSGYDKGQWVPN